MNRQSRGGKSERGAAMLEFGLCLLLFMVVLYSILEFGRFVYSYTVLAGATREATRYAIVHGSRSTAVATADDIRTEVLRWTVGLDPSALAVNTTWDPGNTPGSRVRVQTTYIMAPFTRLIFDAPLTVGARSEMVISQ